MRAELAQLTCTRVHTIGCVLVPMLFAADVAFATLAHVIASTYFKLKFIEQHRANYTARYVVQVNSILDT